MLLRAVVALLAAAACAPSVLRSSGVHVHGLLAPGGGFLSTWSFLLDVELAAPAAAAAAAARAGFSADDLGAFPAHVHQWLGSAPGGGLESFRVTLVDGRWDAALWGLPRACDPHCRSLDAQATRPGASVAAAYPRRPGAARGAGRSAPLGRRRGPSNGTAAESLAAFLLARGPQSESPGEEGGGRDAFERAFVRYAMSAWTGGTAQGSVIDETPVLGGASTQQRAESIRGMLEGGYRSALHEEGGQSIAAHDLQRPTVGGGPGGASAPPPFFHWHRPPFSSTIPQLGASAVRFLLSSNGLDAEGCVGASGAQSHLGGDGAPPPARVAAACHESGYVAASLWRAFASRILPSPNSFRSLDVAARRARAPCGGGGASPAAAGEAATWLCLDIKFRAVLPPSPRATDEAVLAASLGAWRALSPEVRGSAVADVLDYFVNAEDVSEGKNQEGDGGVEDSARRCGSDAQLCDSSLAATLVHNASKWWRALRRRSSSAGVGGGNVDTTSGSVAAAAAAKASCSAAAASDDSPALIHCFAVATWTRAVLSGASGTGAPNRLPPLTSLPYLLAAAPGLRNVKVPQACGGVKGGVVFDRHGGGGQLHVASDCGSGARPCEWQVRSVFALSADAAAESSNAVVIGDGGDLPAVCDGDANVTAPNDSRSGAHIVSSSATRRLRQLALGRGRVTTLIYLDVALPLEVEGSSCAAALAGTAASDLPSSLSSSSSCYQQGLSWVPVAAVRVSDLLPWFAAPVEAISSDLRAGGASRREVLDELEVQRVEVLGDDDEDDGQGNAVRRAAAVVVECSARSLADEGGAARGRVFRRSARIVCRRVSNGVSSGAHGPGARNQPSGSTRLRISVALSYEVAARTLHHAEDLPPDINRGMEIPAGLVTVWDARSSDGSVRSCSCNEEEGRCLPPPLQSNPSAVDCERHPAATHYLPTEAVLLEVHAPDFSMPYNVMALTSTMLAFALGSFINAMARKRS